MAIFRQRRSKVSVEKVMLCPIHCKARQSGVSLESAGFKNIPKFREIEPKLVKVTMRVGRSRLLLNSESEVGPYLGPEARRSALKMFSYVHFNENQGHQELV